MVLKKGKKGARTGNTQRNLPFKVQGDIKAASVRKTTSPLFVRTQEGRTEKKNKDCIEDGDLPAFLKLSLNKKKRWLIKEMVEKKIANDFISEQICNHDDERYEETRANSRKEKKRNRKTSKKRALREMEPSEIEEDEVEPRRRRRSNKKMEKKNEKQIRTVVITRVLDSDSRICKSVCDTEDTAPSAKTSKSWRKQLQDVLTTPATVDVEYEIEEGVQSNTWPFNVHSNLNRKATFYIRENMIWGKPHPFGDTSKSRKKRCDQGYSAFVELKDAATDSNESRRKEAKQFCIGDLTIQKVGRRKGAGKKVRRVQQTEARQQTEAQQQNQLRSCNSASAQLVRFAPKNSLVYKEQDSLMQENWVEISRISRHSIDDVITTDLVSASKSNKTAKSSDQQTPTRVYGASGEERLTKKDGLISYKETTVVVQSCSITPVKLSEMNVSVYLEGKAEPRRFGMLIRNSKDHAHGKKCFLVAEEMLSANTTTTTTTLKIKLFELGQKTMSDRTQHFNQHTAQEISTALDFQRIISEIQESCAPRIGSSTAGGASSTSYSATHEQGNVSGGEDAGFGVVKKLSRWRTSCHGKHDAFGMLFESVLTKTSLKQPEDIEQSDNENDYVLVPTTNATYCEICYADGIDDHRKVAGGSQAVMTDNMKQGTQLLKCLHSFCNHCWGMYLTERIVAGVVGIKCPGYDCETVVDVVTVLGIVRGELASKYLHMLFESSIMQRDDWQWCPGCERAAFCGGFQQEVGGSNEIRKRGFTGLQDQPVVSCACKRDWCFSCLRKPHWPARCEHVEEYDKTARKYAGFFYDSMGQPIKTSVELKKCPFCKTPVSKNNGCNYMLCRCGRNFCWNCSKPFDSKHPTYCKTKSVEVRVFSSLEDAFKGRDKEKKSYLKRVMSYSSRIIQVSRMRTKLGIDKRADDRQLMVTEKQDSKVIMLKRVFCFEKETYSILQQMATGQLIGKLTHGRKQSKHFNRKCMTLFEKVDFLMGRIRDMMRGVDPQKLSDVKFGQLNSLVEATEKELMRLKAWL
eukprot:gene18093-19900_t